VYNITPVQNAKYIETEQPKQYSIGKKGLQSDFFVKKPFNERGNVKINLTDFHKNIARNQLQKAYFTKLLQIFKKSYMIFW